jgi:hypothetical protein
MEEKGCYHKLELPKSHCYDTSINYIHEHIQVSSWVQIVGTILGTSLQHV